MSMYLGLDYGRAHIGVALSERDLATPLPSIENVSLPEVISHLSHYIEDHHVDTIVCGIPEGQLVAEIKSFAQKLKDAFGLPVILHPETLSSKEAIQKLHEGGASRKKLHDDHAYAAVLILEDFLESRSILYTNH